MGDYHQYFIKDGRHIGRYEEMYQNCPDPWNIEKLGPRLDMEAALLLLKGRRVNRFLDIGAGLGLFTGLAARRIWRENPAARGVVTDISPTAVAGAKARLSDPRLDFMTLDARNLGRNQAFSAAFFDLIIMAQALWGLLENLPETLRSLAALLGPGGALLISQHFLASGQTYGADIVAEPGDLADYLEKAGFIIESTLETNRAFNHHWAALAVKRP